MAFIWGMLTAFVVFWAVYFLVRAMAPEEEYQERAPRKGFIAFKRTKLARENPWYVVLRVVVFVPTYYVEKLPIDAWREQLRIRLARAGQPGGLTPDEFVACCTVAGMLGLAFGVVFTVVGMTDASPILAIIPGMVSAYLPLLYLQDLVVRRLTSINRHLPFVLDLLSLSLGAGLDFNSSLESVVNKESQKGPLVEELHYVLQEIKLGVTRRDALLNLKERVESEYLSSVVQAVVQAEAMGTPLSRILQVQAQANRLKRTQRAEKIAAEAGVKILFPLLLILTAVFLTMFGPIIIRYLNGELM